MSERRVSDLKEQTLLTANSFEILKQLVLDASLGSGVDAVNGFNQQIDEVVRDCTATHDSESRKQVRRALSGCRRSSCGSSTATRL